MALCVGDVTYVPCIVCYYLLIWCMTLDSDPGATNPVYNNHHNGEVTPPMPDYNPSKFGQGKVLSVMVGIMNGRSREF